MSANGISHLTTKEARQLAKLDVAKAKREGKTVATDGTVTGPADTSKPYYRTRHKIKLNQLPTVYSGNSIVDNPNSGGLVYGRPWEA